MGFLTTRSYPDSVAVRDAVQECIDLAEGHPIGVNLTIATRERRNERLDGDLDAALDQGVRLFETAGVSVGHLVDRIHEAGGRVIHKCSAIRHALAAERAGVDAVAIVGMEEGGHPGLNELPASLLGALAARQLSIPWALGGGIGTGRQILSAMVLGAQAVVMGSRFLVAEEVEVHPAYKQRLLEADEHSTTTVLRSAGNTWRVLANTTAAEVARLEGLGITDPGEFGEIILGTYAREHCYVAGDWTRGMLSLGPSIGFADRIEPFAEIVRDLAAELDEARAELCPPSTPQPSAPSTTRRIDAGLAEPARR
jgi:nitronate monooxygenase